MISVDELNKSILDLETNRDTTFATCERLAWLYIVRDHIAKAKAKEPLTQSGDSEFLTAINGKSGDAVWQAVDELVTAVGTLHPRMYDSFISKIKNL